MDIEKILSKMTLAQKAKLCAGKDNWTSVPFEALGIPSIWVSDGPHGIRKADEHLDNLGMGKTRPAVCFPTACATACSFDTEMMHRMGQTLGEECHAYDVDILLGPGINIKRSPLCGRNFEYFSEDPVVAAKMGGAFIDGCQEAGVGTSLKHFAMNNQEYRRLSCSSEADERTMREIYLYAFEQIVKKNQPWTVMASYNRINGVYACENRWLLTDLLRDQWGFEGYVMSDWKAVSNRVAGVKAGLDMEMPYADEQNEQSIIQAVQNGTLEEAALDRCVRNILKIVFRCAENRRKVDFDAEAEHQKAAEIAENCMVLLKNDDQILPLSENDRVALIGAFAEKPRYQGGGSSHVNATKVPSARELLPQLPYAQGYVIESEQTDPALLSEALELAAGVEKVVIFAGLPESFESEGMDRKHIRMPQNQVELIEKVAKVNPNVVVVLHNGSVIEMNWLPAVKGVLECYLGGQAVAQAAVSTLYGKNNPSGRLAESFPKRLEDTPCFIDFGGKQNKTHYNEGIFVGYRYYNKRKTDVLFPFGYGLSYTDFAYSDLTVDRESMRESEQITVSVTVKNVGNVFGKEVVQLYVADHTDVQIRPDRELKEFCKVALQPGESRRVSFTLDRYAFSWFNTDLGDFYAAGGCYEIQICKDCRTVLLSKEIQLIAERAMPMEITLNTTLGELLDNERTHDSAKVLFERYLKHHYAGKELTPARVNGAHNAPLRNMIGYTDMKRDELNKTVEQLRDLLRD